MISFCMCVIILFSSTCLFAMEEKAVATGNVTRSFIPFEQEHDEYQLSKTARKKLKRQKRNAQRYALRTQKQEEIKPEPTLEQFVQNSKKEAPSGEKLKKQLLDQLEHADTAPQEINPVVDTNVQEATPASTASDATWSAWFVSWVWASKSQ